MHCRISATIRASVIAAGLFVVGGLFGCGGKSSTTNSSSPASNVQLASANSSVYDGGPGAVNTKPEHVVLLSQETSLADRSRDAAEAIQEYFRVDAYQITVPIGTLGRNEDFWKRIDEQCVDVGTYDLLFKNGLRVGVAPMSEFDTIRTHLDIDSACQKISINGSVAKKVQLETRKDLIGQTIFYFDGGNNAIGRTFDRCTNLIDLSFEPTPRVPGSVRVSFAPEVRACRARLEFSLLNEEREIQFVAPETFYDLNCRADIPKDEFLVLAPSTDADRESSVGHAFLTTDGSPQRMEQVIVLVPHIITADERIGAMPTIASAKTAGKIGR